MKVHPIPKKRNIALRYDVASTLSEATRLACNKQKKLRRLPHIFARVLELPFHSDADVSVQETPDSIRFAATTDGVGDDVRAHTIEIYPGVTKIVIRGNNLLDLSLDELDLDMWRFRLPPCTRPEMASAAYSDGELVVIVPKGASDEEEDGDDGDENEEEGWGEEATARLAGDKPVDQSDAAAIQAAELRQTDCVASAAQSAAAFNELMVRYEDNMMLSDDLWDATTKLPADKPVTRQDVEGVVVAEPRHNSNMATHLGGVAAAMAAAARLS